MNLTAYKFFRIAAGVLVLLAAVHFMGHLSSLNAKPNNGTEFTMKELMDNYKMNVGGTMRTMSELNNGFSLAFSAMSLALGALGFVVPVQRKTAIVFAASMALMTAISVACWFIAPTSFLAVAMVLFAGAAYYEK
jgi:hypothetical protein